MILELTWSGKAELPKEGILFHTQFPSLGIFINEKHIGRNPRFDRVLHYGHYLKAVKGHKADIKESGR